MHAVYCAIHKVQADLPVTKTYRTRIMTDLFGGQPWSWHVVGITRDALSFLSEQEFRYRPGVVRAQKGKRGGEACEHRQTLFSVAGGRVQQAALARANERSVVWAQGARERKEVGFSPCPLQFS